MVMLELRSQDMHLLDHYRSDLLNSVVGIAGGIQEVHTRWHQVSQSKVLCYMQRQQLHDLSVRRMYSAYSNLEFLYS